MPPSTKRFPVLALLTLVSIGTTTVLFSQFRRGGGFGYGRAVRFANEVPQRPSGFSFCRLYYNDVRYFDLGQQWATDYPDSDYNLMLRLSQITTTPIRKDERGDPDHVVVSALQEEIFSCPFLFMSDPGTVGWSDEEAANLREYLLRGGFLWADDFWGERAWNAFQSELAKVLPDYAVVDVPKDHYIFRVFFELDDVPQVPSIQYWNMSGGETSEQGFHSAEPHLRAAFDETGRVMVLMSHNTDIADGWEREGESDLFFELFSIPASYPMGINIVLHSLLQ
jgi:hypothetical protein